MVALFPKANIPVYPTGNVDGENLEGIAYKRERPGLLRASCIRTVAESSLVLERKDGAVRLAAARAGDREGVRSRVALNGTDGLK